MNRQETGKISPFVNRTFEWGVVIATFLSVSSVVPRHCPFDRLPSPKIEKYGANYATANYPYPAAHRKRSLRRQVQDG